MSNIKNSGEVKNNQHEEKMKKIAERKRDHSLTLILNTVKEMRLKIGEEEFLKWNENGRYIVISIECFGGGGQAGSPSFDMKIDSKKDSSEMTALKKSVTKSKQYQQKSSKLAKVANRNDVDVVEKETFVSKGSDSVAMDVLKRAIFDSRAYEKNKQTVTGHDDDFDSDDYNS